MGRRVGWASKQPPRFKNLLGIQAPEGNFPALARTRRASPSPGSRRLLRSERRQARRARVAAATSSPTSPAEAGGPRRESRKGWGARALPGAGARQRRRGQEGRSWEAVTGRRIRKPVRDRNPDGSPGAQGRVRSQPRADEDKAPGSRPSAPSLATRYAASRARPAPARDLIGSGQPQAPPQALDAPPLSGPLSTLRESPRRPWRSMRGLSVGGS